MITENEVHALRIARTELTKRGIDFSRADLRMMHGVLTIRGPLQRTPACMNPDLRIEVEHVAKVLRGRPEVRDVSLDVTYPAA